MERRLHIAWVADADSGGGVPGMSRQFLRSLAEEQVDLDWYSRVSSGSIPELDRLVKRGGMRHFHFPYHWNWESWYGRQPKFAFLVSFLKRMHAFRALGTVLLREHRLRSYDAVVQFSQGELLGLRRHAGELPIVLYPCVHAAGELRWCREEEHLARECERWWWRKFRLVYLGFRSVLQKRDYHLARAVIGMSRIFNEQVSRDYGVSMSKLGVVTHPIAPSRIANHVQTDGGRVRLLFVGRISVRKGLELLVGSAARILASDPELELTIIGAGSLWSNYEPLLKRLPQERCTWRRSVPNDEVIAEMERSDILLIPSHYEPGGIVVGEALAAGMVIVGSDQVGSAENLPRSVFWEHPSASIPSFESAVISAVQAVRENRATIRAQARAVAESQFEPTKVAKSLLSELERLLRPERAASRGRPPLAPWSS